jgi:hypothetical protein
MSENWQTQAMDLKAPLTKQMSVEREAKCNLRKAWMTFVLLVVAEILLPPRASAQWKTPWDYDGPRGAGHWGRSGPGVRCLRNRQGAISD